MLKLCDICGNEFVVRIKEPKPGIIIVKCPYCKQNNEIELKPKKKHIKNN